MTQFAGLNSLGNASGFLGAGADTPLTPTELNDVYTHGQFWIPAGALSGNPGQTPDFLTPYQIPNAYSSYTVGRYSGTVDEEAFFTWGFKADFVAAPSASLLLKFSPLFTCENTVAAPNNKVQFAFGASNALVGTSLDFNNAANEVNFNTTAPVTDILQGGNTSDDQDTAPVGVFGDIVSGGEMNLFQLMVERHAASGGVDDNYLNDILLLGVAVQFAVDFNNVAVWPT